MTDAEFHEWFEENVTKKSATEEFADAVGKMGEAHHARRMGKPVGWVEPPMSEEETKEAIEAAREWARKLFDGGETPALDRLRKAFLKNTGKPLTSFRDLE